MHARAVPVLLALMTPTAWALSAKRAAAAASTEQSLWGKLSGWLTQPGEDEKALNEGSKEAGEDAPWINKCKSAYNDPSACNMTDGDCEWHVDRTFEGGQVESCVVNLEHRTPEEVCLASGENCCLFLEHDSDVHALRAAKKKINNRRSAKSNEHVCLASPVVGDLTTAFNRDHKLFSCESCEDKDSHRKYLCDDGQHVATNLVWLLPTTSSIPPEFTASHESKCRQCCVQTSNLEAVRNKRSDEVKFFVAKDEKCHAHPVHAKDSTESSEAVQLDTVAQQAHQACSVIKATKTVGQREINQHARRARAHKQGKANV